MYDNDRNQCDYGGFILESDLGDCPNVCGSPKDPEFG